MEDADESPARRRILDAAFLAFMEKGYADTSTLEIARRARVSKRELYALVGNKQEMLIACIAPRAERLRVPADLPEPRDRATLSRILENLGARLLREVSDPAVIAVFRLAIAEAVRAPEVARALDAIGSETSRAALREIMTRARSAGLVSGNPALMPDSSPGCSGAISCWACCFASRSGQPPRRSRGEPAMRRRLSCRSIRNRMPE